MDISRQPDPNFLETLRNSFLNFSLQQVDGIVNTMMFHFPHVATTIADEREYASTVSSYETYQLMVHTFMRDSDTLKAKLKDRASSLAGYKFNIAVQNFRNGNLKLAFDAARLAKSWLDKHKIYSFQVGCLLWALALAERNYEKALEAVKSCENTLKDDLGVFVNALENAQKRAAKNAEKKAKRQLKKEKVENERIAAVIKKLKQINDEQKDGLMKELQSIDLSKFVSEAVTAICDAKLESSDIQAVVQICDLLHHSYNDFSPSLTQELLKVFFPGKSGDDLDADLKTMKKLSTLKLLLELYFVGVIEDIGIFFNIIMDLTSTEHMKDRDATRYNLTLLANFAQQGRVFLGLPLSGPEIQDEIFKGLNITAHRKETFWKAFDAYYAAVTKLLQSEHALLRQMEHENAKILDAKGEISEENASLYEELRKSYDNLYRGVLSLAEAIYRLSPVMPDDSHITRVTTGEGASPPATREESSTPEAILDDEDIKVLYEGLPDLRSFLPVVLSGEAEAKMIEQASRGQEQPTFSKALNITADQKKTFRKAFDAYYDAVTEILQSEHASLRQMERENAKILNAKVELSEENASWNEQLRKSYDRLYHNVSFLAKVLDKQPPVMLEDSHPMRVTTAEDTSPPASGIGSSTLEANVQVGEAEPKVIEQTSKGQEQPTQQQQKEDSEIDDIEEIASNRFLYKEGLVESTLKYKILPHTIQNGAHGADCHFAKAHHFCFGGFQKSIDVGIIQYDDKVKAMQEFEWMMGMKLNHPHESFPILKAYHLDEREDLGVYNVLIEHSTPFKTWLDQQIDEFNRKLEAEVGDVSPKELWWKHIRMHLKRIFRDVVRGLSILNKQGLSCLGLKSSVGVFVTNDNHGRIMACYHSELQPEGQAANACDVFELGHALYGVLMSPFGKVDIDGDIFTLVESQQQEFCLDAEFVKWIEILNEDYLSTTEFAYLIDHPFIWTKGERIDFMCALLELWKLTKLGDKATNFHPMNTYLQADWVKIFDTDHVTVFGDIFQFKQTKASKYATPFDVVRYFTNALRHYNDDSHSQHRTKLLQDVEIEWAFRQRASTTYAELFYALIMIEFDNSWNDSEARRKLLPSAFARGVCDQCSHMDCDHLLE